MDIIPIAPITFTEQKLNLSFHLRATNIGRSVALNSIFSVRVIIPPLSNKISEGTFSLQSYVLSEQKRACQNIVTEFLSYSTFPGRAHEANHAFTLGPKDIERGHFPESRYVMIYLVGCVDYQFSGFEGHHQTRFAYELYRLPKGKPYSMRSLLNIGEDVPLDEIVLQKTVMADTDYAD